MFPPTWIFASCLSPPPPPHSSPLPPSVASRGGPSPPHPEAEFLGVIGTKVVRAFLLAIHIHSPLFTSTNGFYSPLEQKWMVWNVNIVHKNFQFENSQDYAQEVGRAVYKCTVVKCTLKLEKRLCPVSTKLCVHEFGFWTLFMTSSSQSV